MPVETVDASGALLHLKLGGRLRVAEFEHVTRIAEEMIGRCGKINILIELHDFNGWERNEQWADVSFATEHDEHIGKMAIVGEEKWKEDFFAFTMQPLRTTAIEFFDPSRIEEARNWVKTK
jgi:hypothetical protein